jgi:glucosyl-3-phosphoglycerate phosphatase
MDMGKVLSASGSIDSESLNASMSVSNEGALLRTSLTLNHLVGLEPLKNRYFAIRHGKSEANALGIHSGCQTIGATRYSLVEEGRQQVAQSIASAIQSLQLGPDTIIISSDYLRTRETAAICRAALGAGDVSVELALGERGAGTYEGKQSSREEKKKLGEALRALDAKDPDHNLYGLESARSVMDRSTSLIRRLEEQYQGRTILLVSHHDTIQILRTAFSMKCPGSFWQMGRIENAELVPLSFGE